MVKVHSKVDPRVSIDCGISGAFELPRCDYHADGSTEAKRIVGEFKREAYDKSGGSCDAVNRVFLERVDGALIAGDVHVDVDGNWQLGPAPEIRAGEIS